MIAAIMKGIEIKSPRLVVIGSPFSGDELQRLANPRRGHPDRRRRPRGRGGKAPERSLAPSQAEK